jgi:hypothetical protein
VGSDRFPLHLLLHMLSFFLSSVPPNTLSNALFLPSTSLDSHNVMKSQTLYFLPLHNPYRDPGILRKIFSTNALYEFWRISSIEVKIRFIACICHISVEFCVTEAESCRKALCLSQKMLADVVVKFRPFLPSIPAIKDLILL